jgi:putative colanic acid biosynthesis UDP-glucose lipid carrier transferase
MHKRKRLYQLARNGADLVILSLAFLFMASLAKIHAYGKENPFSLAPWELLLWGMLVIVWQVSAHITGIYDDLRTRYAFFEFLAILKNSLIQLLASALILFIIKTVVLNRYFSLLYFACLTVLITVEKTALRFFLRWQRSRGRNLRFILVVGGGEVGRRFCETITATPETGYRVVGILDDHPKSGSPFHSLGIIANLETVLERHLVDEVVVALPRGDESKLEQVVALCENWPVQIRVIPDYSQFASSRFEVSSFSNFPMISIRTIPLEESHWRLLKRLFDLAFTLTLFLLVFFWLWPLLALAVKLSSPGPVFFKQERWGRGNRRIICYKFRTMVQESRDIDANGRYLQASRNDPRVTRVGRFLRRSNLDELPQFYNVLKGEMSVVGPRPHPTPLNLQSKNHIDRYLLRHMVKPGITGWAQIRGFRGETRDIEHMHKRVEHDIWYIDNWSFWLDIQIIILTIWKILQGDPRAY